MEPSDQVNALSRMVLEAALEVHRHLGPAFVESVYENALCHELLERSIRFARQVAVAVQYKGRIVGVGRADLIVDELVVVELKAVPALAPVHVAQVISYLKATSFTLGLLVNFGGRRLEDGFKRVILT